MTITVSVWSVKKEYVEKKEKIKRLSDKRHRVLIRVPTLNRDKSKSQVSTCVNFIHQKDAYIAMKVVEHL